MRGVWVGLSVMLGALLWHPASAGAQTERDEEARSLFQAGQAAYASGHYEDALERFETSYELSGRATLLFNIGSAAERLRRDERALEAYSMYLQEVPDAENRAEVESRIRILRDTLSESGDAETHPPPATASQTGTSAPGRGLRLAGWVMAGLAVVAGVGSAAFWARGSTLYSDLVVDCRTRGGCTDQEVGESNVGTFDTLTNLSWAVAAVAGATSITLLVLGYGRRGDHEARVSISPTGLSFRGAF